MSNLPPFITKETRPLSDLNRFLNWFDQSAVNRYNDEKYIAKCEVIK